MIETEIDVLRDTLSDVRNLLSSDCDMKYLHSRAKTLNVEKLLKELLVNE